MCPLYKSMKTQAKDMMLTWSTYHSDVAGHKRFYATKNLPAKFQYLNTLVAIPLSKVSKKDKSVKASDIHDSGLEDEPEK